MNSPVPSFVADPCRSLLQKHGGEGFWDDQETDKSEEKGHDSSNVLGPAPAEIRVDDESTDDWTSYWTDECCSCEYGDSDAASDGVPEISHGAADDGQRTRGEESTEEPTDEDGVQVLSDGDGDLEDCKDEESGEERYSASVEFGNRRPEEWSERKS